VTGNDTDPEYVKKNMNTDGSDSFGEMVLLPSLSSLPLAIAYFFKVENKRTSDL
jgi:hypothetical protein